MRRRTRVTGEWGGGSGEWGGMGDANLDEGLGRGVRSENLLMKYILSSITQRL